MTSHPLGWSQLIGDPAEGCSDVNYIYDDRGRRDDSADPWAGAREEAEAGFSRRKERIEIVGPGGSTYGVRVVSWNGTTCGYGSQYDVGDILRWSRVRPRTR